MTFSNESRNKYPALQVIKEEENSFITNSIIFHEVGEYKEA